MNAYSWEQIQQTGLPEMPEIGKMQIRAATGPMRMEFHPEMIEFLLLYSGCKRMWVEGKRYDMQGGDLLIIFPGENHGAEDVIQNRSALCYFLMAVPTAMKKFCMLEENERAFLWQQLCSLPSRMFKLPIPARREMERLFNSVGDTSPLSAAVTRLRLTDFLFQVLEARSPDKPQLPEDISSVIRYIRDCHNEMPDVPQMAALVNLSESRFKQKFKQATGIPPAEFMIREKISQSKLLLRDTERTITSIAMELGFSSSQHFSVLFKRYVGESPVQYRKTMDSYDNTF